MAKLDIIDVPHPTLKKRAQEFEVSKIDDQTRNFIQDMIETMQEAPGVGLAAPQVNVSKRIIVIDVSSDYPDRKPFAMINPVIVEKSGDTCIEEGCLSVPEFRAEIPRSKNIKVEYYDENGNKQVLEDDGFLAIVIQHEIDHLDGITMLDHVSPMKRMMYLKKLKKLQKRSDFAILSS